jgi:hypothetical protein
MGLSIRAYARRRGVSHVAVLRAIKQGRVVPSFRRVAIMVNVSS